MGNAFNIISWYKDKDNAQPFAGPGRSEKMKEKGMISTRAAIAKDKFLSGYN